MISRVRNKLLQIVLPFWLRPHSVVELVRLGTDYGGWWVPAASVRPGAIAYCAGAGEDISFDLALHEAGCHVATFDPTPRAIEHVAMNAPKDTRFRFIPIGWWDSTTELRFYVPSNPLHVSHSAVNLQCTTDYFTAAVRSVFELMSDLGDGHVDIIKMDIEGAEYRVIDSLLQFGPLAPVLCIEFDQPQPVRRTIAAVRRLLAGGYALSHIDRWNYTFVMKA